MATLTADDQALLPFRAGRLVLPVVCSGIGIAATTVVGSGASSSDQPIVMLLSVWALWPLVGAVLLDAAPRCRLGPLLCAAGMLPVVAVLWAAAEVGGRPPPASAAVAMHALGGVAAALTIVVAPLVVVGGKGRGREWIIGCALVGGLAVAAGLPVPGWIGVGCSAVLAGVSIRRGGAGDDHRGRQGLWTVGFVGLAGAVAVLALLVPSGSGPPSAWPGLVVALACAPVALAVLALKERFGPPGAALLDLGLAAAASAAVLGSLAFSRELFTRLGLTNPAAAAAMAALVVAAAALPVILAARSRVLLSWYGPASQSSRALAELNRSLRETDDPRELLGAAADMAARAVDSSHASITLGVDAPDQGADDIVVPLMVCGEQAGTLMVSPPRRGRPLEARDLEVLALLAVPIALVARAVGVAVDSEHSRRDDRRARLIERELILADLHDGLGPMLAGLSMGVAGLQHQAGAGHPELEATLGGVADGLAEARYELRRIVTGLAPAPLSRSDLGTALSDLVGQVRALGGVGAPRIHLDVDLPNAIGEEVAVTVYRTVAEALTNVLRHARATSCSVDVGRTSESALEIRVVDDGIGLPTGPPPTLGIGLGSMRRRAEALGGWMHVASSEGGGTVLVMGIPIRDLS